MCVCVHQLFVVGSALFMPNPGSMLFDVKDLNGRHTIEDVRELSWHSNPITP